MMQEPSGYLRYGGVPHPREGDTVGNVNKVGCVFIFLFSYFFFFISIAFLSLLIKKKSATTRYLCCGGVPRPREVTQWVT